MKKLNSLSKKIIVCIIGVVLLNAVIAPAITTITVLRSLVGVVPAFTDTIDTAKPAGTDDPSEADDNMRRIQAGFQEILAVEHDADLTGTEITGDGKHTDITTDSIVNAGALANTGDFAINTDKFTVTAATGNTIVAGTLDVAGNIDPTSYETTNGGFLDENDMATDSDTAVASQQSIKKYVDDEVANSVAASAAKAWCQVESDGTLKAGSHNITSSAKNETGVYTITWDTDFANTLYVPIITPISTQNVAKQGWVSSLAAGSCVVTMANAAGTKQDTAFTIAAFGTQ